MQKKQIVGNSITKPPEAFKFQNEVALSLGYPAESGLLIQDKEYLRILRTKYRFALLILISQRISFTGAGCTMLEPDVIAYGKLLVGSQLLIDQRRRIAGHISPWNLSSPGP